MSGRVRGLRGHRWLVLACETKVVLRDLRSGEMQEVPRSVLDARAPTRLAFLFINSPALLGGSGPPLGLLILGCMMHRRSWSPDAEAREVMEGCDLAGSAWREAIFCTHICMTSVCPGDSFRR